MNRNSLSRTLIILSPIFLLAGCGASHILTPLPQNGALEWPPVTVLGAENTHASESPVSEVTEESPSPYTVLYESPDSQAALYEPEYGCYLAAQPDGDEKDAPAVFTQRTGVKQAVFTREMTLGDEFPEMWLLNCIVAQAVPMMVIHPSGTSHTFSAGEMTALADAFGAYHMPMFVVFFPLSEQDAGDPATYALYFRYARAIFAERAPEAAFVWAADVRLQNADQWYPGDEAVDWVGFTMTESLTDNGLDEKILDDFDAYYHLYQQDKPIMLTKLAVSHFSALDYTYYTKEAAAELERLYTALRDLYPRVKLISYWDENELSDGGDALRSTDDYAITGDEILLEAYRRATDDRRFLTEAPTTEMEDGARVGWLRSEYAGYYVDGHIYLDPRVITKELRLPTPAGKTRIGGVDCVDASTYSEPSVFFCTADHERLLLYIYIKT